MRKIKLLFFLSVCCTVLLSCAQEQSRIITGAEQTTLYFPLLQNKRIAVVANHTSLIGETHLVDSLLASGFQVVRIFSPEHGFRGNTGAGQTIKNGTDPKTGLPVISLYGKHKKPVSGDLKDVNMVVFDIQDVGARFYTYISTMTYVMEACAENHIPVMILDRPNPNGFYVDGPVLEPEYSSFVGLHPVPVVYGMTIGEYAQMVNGEHWLADSLQCNLTVIPLKNYSHDRFYELPVKPSPNLPNKYAVYLYPSLCFFEGTVVSVGRGTGLPFQVIGHPGYSGGNYQFTPHPVPGAALHPKLEGKTCHGLNLVDYAKKMKQNPPQLHLHWLIDFYKALNDSSGFFNGFFTKLAGTKKLQQQIESGWSEEQIRQSWKPALETFKEIRKKYLLYP